MEESFSFALKRKTFGRPLVEHDVIKSLLARCASRVEQQHAWLETVSHTNMHDAHTRTGTHTNTHTPAHAHTHTRRYTTSSRR